VLQRQATPITFLALKWVSCKWRCSPVFTAVCVMVQEGADAGRCGARRAKIATFVQQRALECTENGIRDFSYGERTFKREREKGDDY